MVPILQEVSEKLGDKIQVVKIDTEKYTSIANRYQIEALPTFIIFKNGKPCHRFVSFEDPPFLNFNWFVNANNNEVISFFVVYAVFHFCFGNAGGSAAC